MRKIFLLICLCSFSFAYAGLPYDESSDEFADSSYDNEEDSYTYTTCSASRYNEGDCDDFGSNGVPYNDEENSDTDESDNENSYRRVKFR